MNLASSKWSHGLWAAMIGGAATSLDSGFALLIMAPDKFNLGPALLLTLKTVLVIGALAGLKVGFAYLKQAPLPDWDGLDRRDATPPLPDKAA